MDAALKIGTDAKRATKYTKWAYGTAVVMHKKKTVLGYQTSQALCISHWAKIHQLGHRMTFFQVTDHREEGEADTAGHTHLALLAWHATLKM